MKNCIFKLSLMASGALLASGAFAQSASQPGDLGATMALKTAASTAKPQNVTAPSLPTATTSTTVAANLKPALSATGIKAVIAAGSVLVLSDGIVHSTALTQIQPPAPGFMYEL